MSGVPRGFAAIKVLTVNFRRLAAGREAAKRIAQKRRQAVALYKAALKTNPNAKPPEFLLRKAAQTALHAFSLECPCGYAGQTNTHITKLHTLSCPRCGSQNLKFGKLKAAAVSPELRKLKLCKPPL